MAQRRLRAWQRRALLLLFMDGFSPKQLARYFGLTLSEAEDVIRRFSRRH